MKLSPLPVVVCSLGLLAAPFEAQSTTLVSQSSLGVQGLKKSNGPSVSALGSYVSFESEVQTLVPGDANKLKDIFVRDTRRGLTTRVSVDSFGVEANAASDYAQISANGRFVVFQSRADNLVLGDTNGVQDIFLHDRVTAQTIRVSVDSNGIESDDNSWFPQVSYDGRFIVFQSEGTNLVPGDTNGHTDIFVHDRIAGTTVRASVNSAGKQALAFDSAFPSISGDGHVVSFTSAGHNFVAGDTNQANDTFLHNLVTGTTIRVSVSSSGAQAMGGNSTDSKLSEDGRFVAFSSTATNLVANDTNGWLDTFVHDTVTGTTIRVDVSSTGAQSEEGGWAPSISANGRFVAFKTQATNLLPEDLNGQDKDIFIHDVLTGATRLVSVNSFGIQANGFASQPSISPDGNFIAFYSGASNLIPEDRNKRNWDVFLHALPRVRDL